MDGFQWKVQVKVSLPPYSVQPGNLPMNSWTPGLPGCLIFAATAAAALPHFDYMFLLGSSGTILLHLNLITNYTSLTLPKYLCIQAGNNL